MLYLRRLPFPYSCYLLLLLLLLTGCGLSEPKDTAAKTAKDATLILKQTAAYSFEGADTCLACHDQDDAFNVAGIFQTPHGHANSRGGPFSPGGLQCESCHGALGKHGKKRLRKGESREAMIAFKAFEAVPVAAKNAVCLNCHQQPVSGHWQGSPHQRSDIACSDCHQIHQKTDPMTANRGQISRCGSCHVRQKLAFNQAYSHPLRYGQMGCADCHNGHDSQADALLKETCFICHAQKRGPFLWEHEPVGDSCINCHRPHGSNHRGQLSQRQPGLCQSCHNTPDHAGFLYGGNALPSGQPSVFLLGRSCGNCHSQIHGSNHPSGNTLQR